ncbi:hypothetical protein Cgig2_026068 [Carnegiea gigantea]|uniref:Uncharacterized protein n=1 Tax=Carnegiea gigantea TaxID=171969 RepID=A0A9Q1QL96_9CARY|nr:hypothetical protein Cgig2_026068 [Carnegiea gigantea]
MIAAGVAAKLLMVAALFHARLRAATTRPIRLLLMILVEGILVPQLQINENEDEAIIESEFTRQSSDLGGEDNLAAKLDALIEGCNNTCLRSAPQIEDRTNLQITHPGLPPVTKRKRLSEANLDVYSPCQELDQICNVNCWMLPTYNVAASEGGFQASVTMKGPDFECSSEGSVCAASHEARNSAASNLLAKLRSMAAES